MANNLISLKGIEMRKREQQHKARKSLEQLRLVGFPTPFDEPSGAEKISGGVNVTAYTAQERLRNEVIAFEALVARIDRDDHLTQAGKDARLQKLADETLTKIDGVKRLTLDNVRTKLDGLKAEFTKATIADSPDDIAAFFREREIRDTIAAMPESERHAQFWQAVEHGDDATIEAFIRAPRIRRLLDADTLEQGLEIWRERKNPELARQVSELQGVHDVLAGDFNSVTNAVRHAGGIEDPMKIIGPGGSEEDYVPEPIEGDSDTE